MPVSSVTSLAPFHPKHHDTSHSGTLVIDLLHDRTLTASRILRDEIRRHRPDAM